MHFSKKIQQCQCGGNLFILTEKKLFHVLYSLPKSRNVVVESLKIYLDEVDLFALMLDLRLG